MKENKGGWAVEGCIAGFLEMHVNLKYPPLFLLPEIAGAGGFLQGNQGTLMTPGFPEKDYPNGALYQVLPHAHGHFSLTSEEAMLTFV